MTIAIHYLTVKLVYSKHPLVLIVYYKSLITYAAKIT